MIDNTRCFYRAVCDMCLSIDANVLCNIVEQLCSAYSVAYRLQSWRNSHHDLTLTRKWVERLCSDNRLSTQSNQLLRLLVDQIPVMLRELFTGSSSELISDGIIEVFLTILLSQGLFYGNGSMTSHFRFDTF